MRALTLLVTSSLALGACGGEQPSDEARPTTVAPDGTPSTAETPTTIHRPMATPDTSVAATTVPAPEPDRGGLGESISIGDDVTIRILDPQR